MVRRVRLAVLAEFQTGGGGGSREFDRLPGIATNAGRTLVDGQYTLENGFGTEKEYFRQGNDPSRPSPWRYPI